MSFRVVARWMYCAFLLPCPALAQSQTAITLDMLEGPACFEQPNVECLTDMLAGTMTDLRNSLRSPDMKEKTDVAFAAAPYLIPFAQSKFTGAANLQGDQQFGPFVLAQNAIEVWPVVLASVLDVGDADQAHVLYQTLRTFAHGMRLPTGESVAFGMTQQFERMRDKRKGLAGAHKLVTALTSKPEAVGSALIPFARAVGLADTEAVRTLIDIWPAEAVDILVGNLSVRPSDIPLAVYELAVARASTPSAKQKVAARVGCPNDATTADCLKIVEAAGKSDFLAFTALYLRAVEKNDEPALVGQRLAAAPVAADTAPWLRTYRTFLLLHIKGELAAQIPAIIGIFTAAPNDKSHPEAASKLAELMVQDQTLPVESFVAAMPQLNAAWRHSRASASVVIIHLVRALLARDVQAVDTFLRSLPMADVASAFYPEMSEELRRKGLESIAREITETRTKLEARYADQEYAHSVLVAGQAGDMSKVLSLLKLGSFDARQFAMERLLSKFNRKPVDPKMLGDIAAAWPHEFFKSYVRTERLSTYSPGAPVSDQVLLAGALAALQDEDKLTQISAKGWVLGYALSSNDVTLLLKTASTLRAAGVPTWPHLVGKAAFLMPRP